MHSSCKIQQYQQHLCGYVSSVSEHASSSRQSHCFNCACACCFINNGLSCFCQSYQLFPGPHGIRRPRNGYCVGDCCGYWASKQLFGICYVSVAVSVCSFPLRVFCRVKVLQVRSRNATLCDCVNDRELVRRSLFLDNCVEIERILC